MGCAASLQRKPNGDEENQQLQKRERRKKNAPGGAEPFDRKRKGRKNTKSRGLNESALIPYECSDSEGSFSGASSTSTFRSVASRRAWSESDSEDVEQWQHQKRSSIRSATPLNGSITDLNMSRSSCTAVEFFTSQDGSPKMASPASGSFAGSPITNVMSPSGVHLRSTSSAPQSPKTSPGKAPWSLGSSDRRGSMTQGASASGGGRTEDSVVPAAEWIHSDDDSDSTMSSEVQSVVTMYLA